MVQPLVAIKIAVMCRLYFRYHIEFNIETAGHCNPGKHRNETRQCSFQQVWLYLSGICNITKGPVYMYNVSPIVVLQALGVRNTDIR